MLNGDHDGALPTCYIRNDVAHFIKVLRNNKIYEKVSTQIKTFYLNAIGLLFWAKNFNLIKDIVEQILVLCKTEFEDEETTSLIKESKSTLFGLIQHHKSAKLYKSENEEDELDTDIDDSSVYATDGFWFDDINKRIDKAHLKHCNDSFNEPNMLFFPNLVGHLRSITFTLPLWGAAMVDIFNSPNINVSSANQESGFRCIKNNLFKFVGKQRADQFLQSHINDLIGNTRLAIADLNNYKLAKNVKTTSNPAKESILIGKLYYNSQTNTETFCYLIESITSGHEENPEENYTPKSKPPSLRTLSSIMEQQANPMENSKENSEENPEENPEENWRGLNTPKSKPPSATRRRPLSSILEPQANPMGLRSSRINILQSPKSFVSKTTNVEFTCCFDAMTMCFVSIYLDHPNFKTAIDGSDLEYPKFIQYFSINGHNTKVKNDRTKLLCTIFKKDIKKTQTISCEANATDMIKSICDKICLKFMKMFWS